MIETPQIMVPAEAKKWHCGSLTYTKIGLARLFGCLLWGNLCFTLMTQVIPSILPLKLRSLGASNLLIGILLTSVFPIVGTFVSPYLSFKSDYLRTRWGRRIPFFACSLPVVCISIVLLGCSDDIAHLLRHAGILPNLSPAMAALGVIGVCTIAFQISDVLISSVYQYIFNDTVPVPLIGRFMGLIQITGGVVAFFYNYFIFRYAENDMKEIFLSVAFFYFAGIGTVCLFVREGAYPPVTDKERAKTRGWDGFKTFFRESFSTQFYWTKFSYAVIPGLISATTAPFNIFFYQDMGLTLVEVGKALGALAVSGIVAAYFSSIFIDRWHPLRILTYSAVFAVVFMAANWVWLFVTLSPAMFFWFYFLGGGFIGTFHGALSTVAGLPFDIRLQPKSRFGQFCSAQSILRNACTVLGGVAIGLFFDFLKWIFHGSGYAYRFSFLWSEVWLLLAAWLICRLYRQWKALGGDLEFQPPAPWSEKGFEEMEQTPFVGVQTRWLSYALSTVRFGFIISILYLPPLAAWLWRLGWIADVAWCLLGLLPCSLLLYGTWRRVENSIRADVARYTAGHPLRDGIPHHGVFLVKACAIVMLLAVCIGETIVAIREGLHGSVLTFGIGNQITNALLIAAVLVLCRLERGYDPMLNYDSRAEKENAGR